MNKFSAFSLLLSNCCVALLYHNNSIQPNSRKEVQLETLLAGILKKGPNRNQDNISAEKIQAAHLATINSLAKEIMAGPIMTYYQ